ncbi:hypothetical protein IL54_0997 [Sphingobium sp. ba1]|nr:hypothetical protein IL54_0997 [Sphingobium sp. ba1]
MQEPRLAPTRSTPMLDIPSGDVENRDVDP